MESDPAGNWDELALLVRALEGDAEALAEAAEKPGLVARARETLVAGSLALELSAREAPVACPPEWVESLRQTTALWMLIQEASRSVAERLDQAGVTWTPIKGFDVGTRFYARPERRPISDLDILVARKDLEAARSSLEEAGWRPLEPTDRTRRFVAEEGYTYHFSGDPVAGLPPVLLEVHFRFWGFVVEEMAGEMLGRLRPWEGPVPGSARLAPADAYILAAAHGWTKTSPRDLVDWCDLDAILTAAREAGLATKLMGTVVSRARRWSIELPICLSARVAARLWPETGHQDVVSALVPSLGAGERRLLERLDGHGIDAVPLSRIVLARLRAGRRSRAGWRSVWRRVWAHPGVVELETAAERPWALRRIEHLVRSLGGSGR